jgi:acetyl esterase/lipase
MFDFNHRLIGLLVIGLALCASNAFSQQSENSDEIADRIVSKTEVWPSKIVVPDNVEMQEVVYAHRKESDLDLTYFTRKETRNKRPAILFVHGGSWKHGDKYQFYHQAVCLTQRYNLFSVCINYRLSDAAKYPAALSDCKTAVRWIRSVAEEHQIDTDRIAICGGSAGAHLSSLVALTHGVKKFDVEGPYSEYSSEVHLALLFNGHFDLAEQLKEHIQDGAMFQFFGYHPWERPDIYGEASPILWVNANSPPMLFLHGDEDYYPHKQSIAMADRLEHYGVDADLEIYEGKGHAWFNGAQDREITIKRVAEFVEKHFGLKELL